MQLKWVILVAGLACPLALPAFAAPCTTSGEASARLIPPPADPRQSILFAVQLGAAVSPASFDKADRKEACARGEFAVGSETFSLSGENGDALPRKAISQRPDGPTFYLAPFSNVAALIGSEGAGQPARPTASAYLLVLLDSETAVGKRVYDRIPTDEVLKADIARALTDGVRLVEFDRQRKGLQLFVAPPPSPPPSSTLGFRPPAGFGAGTPSIMPGVDGRVFTDAPEGGAHHAASGFTCPAAVLGRTRNRLTIFDAADNGRDVLCGYGAPGEASWYSLYLTKLPRQRGSEVFQAYVDQAKTTTPSTGDVAPPLPAGPAPAPGFAAFWNDREGMVQGLWMTQIGDWHVKLRVTYRPGLESEAKSMAEALYKAIHEQVRAPII